MDIPSSTDIPSLTPELRKYIRKEYEDVVSPEFMNMLLVGKAAYEHGYRGFITKEKFMEWVSYMYNTGEDQKKIRRGEKHGKVLTSSVDVINAALFLEFFGKRDGFLSAK